jgi:hypothetical protein
VGGVAVFITAATAGVVVVARNDHTRALCDDPSSIATFNRHMRGLGHHKRALDTKHGTTHYAALLKRQTSTRELHGVAQLSVLQKQGAPLFALSPRRTPIIQKLSKSHRTKFARHGSSVYCYLNRTTSDPSERLVARCLKVQVIGLNVDLRHQTARERCTRSSENNRVEWLETKSSQVGMVDARLVAAWSFDERCGMANDCERHRPNL